MAQLRAVLLALLVLSPASASAEWPLPWTTTDTALHVAMGIAILGDVSTTHYFSSPDAINKAEGRYYYKEMNPLLGPNPSHAAINRAGLIGFGLHLGVSYLLPTIEARRAWQVIGLTVETGMVLRNLSIGCKFSMPW